MVTLLLVNLSIVNYTDMKIPYIKEFHQICLDAGSMILQLVRLITVLVEYNPYLLLLGPDVEK